MRKSCPNVLATVTGKLARLGREAAGDADVRRASNQPKSAFRMPAEVSCGILRQFSST
jgi:hypothetical protein